MFAFKIKQFGADPEVFLQKDGQPWSAEGIFGGSKRNPKPMKGLPPGFFIQEDNVAAEYNIPPTDDPQEFHKYIKRGLTYIRQRARRRKMDLLFAPAADFMIEHVTTPHALELGCEPDFNAWTEAKNPRPRPPRTMRTAAAHIHFSWDDPSPEQAYAFVRALDLRVCIPTLRMAPRSARRELYGKAGACRIKSYGVEYRVLDNFWLENAHLTDWILRTAKSTAMSLDKEFFTQLLVKHGDDIQRAINTHDLDLADELMNVFDLVTPE